MDSELAGIHLPGSDLVATIWDAVFKGHDSMDLQDQRDDDGSLDTRWTWLEMAIYWLKHFDDKIPTPTSKGTWEDSLRGGRHRPTVAAIVHLVRRFFHQLGTFFRGRHFFLATDSRCCHLPCILHRGVCTLDCHSLCWRRRKKSSENFVAHRPIRVVNDLTRPLR